MTTLVLTLSTIGIIAAGILEGGLIMVGRMIAASANELPPPVSVRLHQAMLDGQPDAFMLPAGVIAGLSSVAILIIHHNLNAVSAAFYSVAVVGAVIVMIMSRFFNVATNLRIRGMTAETIPAHYDEIRQTWTKVHGVRIFGGALALVGLTAATLAG